MNLLNKTCTIKSLSSGKIYFVFLEDIVKFKEVFADNSFLKCGQNKKYVRIMNTDYISIQCVNFL